ncbi:hypothetical protein AAMO2058_000680800 [Amorphochlora amoebiformis]
MARILLPLLLIFPLLALSTLPIRVQRAEKIVIPVDFFSRAKNGSKIIRIEENERDLKTSTISKVHSQALTSAECANFRAESTSPITVVLDSITYHTINRGDSVGRQTEDSTISATGSISDFSGLLLSATFIWGGFCPILSREFNLFFVGPQTTSSNSGVALTFFTVEGSSRCAYTSGTTFRLFWIHAVRSNGKFLHTDLRESASLSLSTPVTTNFFDLATFRDADFTLGLTLYTYITFRPTVGPPKCYQCSITAFSTSAKGAMWAVFYGTDSNPILQIKEQPTSIISSCGQAYKDVFPNIGTHPAVCSTVDPCTSTVWGCPLGGGKIHNDSSICTAAKMLGIPANQAFTLEYTGGIGSVSSCTANGITSNSFSQSWDHSFRFQVATTLSPTATSANGGTGGGGGGGSNTAAIVGGVVGGVVLVGVVIAVLYCLSRRSSKNTKVIVEKKDETKDTGLEVMGNHESNPINPRISVTATSVQTNAEYPPGRHSDSSNLPGIYPPGGAGVPPAMNQPSDAPGIPSKIPRDNHPPIPTESVPPVPPMEGNPPQYYEGKIEEDNVPEVAAVVDDHPNHYGLPE